MSRKNGWEAYRREEDGKLGWRVWSQGNIIGTDGGQGYENEQDMIDAALSVASWITAADRSGLLEAPLDLD